MAISKKGSRKRGTGTGRGGGNARRRLDVAIDLRGREGEDLPNAAVYRVTASGKPLEKLAEARNGRVEFDPAWAEGGDRIALGPDADLRDLQKGQLVMLSLARTLPRLEKNPTLQITPDRWRLWPLFQTCVHGEVRACRWIFPPLPLPPLPFAPVPGPFAPATPVPGGGFLHPLCTPVCDGVVEIYERTCCCHPWRIVDDLLDRIPDILGPWPPIDPPFPPDPPIGPFPGPRPGPFPGPRPGPDPAPIDRRVAAGIKTARGEGLRLEEPVPERVLTDLRALRRMPRPQAVEYVSARPYLWPLACTCSTRKVGETVINADGTFSFCYTTLPVLSPVGTTCTRTYAYKVRQFQETQWVTIYDGIARSEYFTAGESADLHSWHPLARGCDDPGPDIDHDGDFVALDVVGGTSSHHLVSPLQNAVEGLANAGLAANTGLVFPPGGGAGAPHDRPWARTLALRLKFSHGMRTKARYYRVSVARADANGDPAGAWRYLIDPVAWQYYEYDPVLDRYVIKSQALGPDVVGGEQGLYEIPDPAREWRGIQYHQRWDTTDETGLGGTSGGRHLLRIEVFDASGNRVKPTGATGAGTPKGFDFLRLTSETTGTPVPFATLVHCFWLDNRPCVGDIKDLRLNGPQTDDCLFLKAAGTDQVRVGFAAGHFGGPPGETFMRWYSLGWRRGMNGPSGTFQSGNANHPDPFSNVSTPSNAKTVNDLIGAGQACTFALTLNVYPKHWTGSDYVDAYEAHDVASFALENTG